MPILANAEDSSKRFDQNYTSFLQGPPMGNF